MEQYEKGIKKLLTYIEYFEDEHRNIARKIKSDSFTYISYDPILESFIHDVYESGLLMEEYVEYLALYEKYQDDYTDLIKIADFDTIRAILTGYVEQEKYHEGLWKRAYDEKIFLHILYALHKLLKKQGLTK